MMSSEPDRGDTLPPSSLIICTRNRPNMVCETIQAVLRGDAVPAELIVVDQSDEPHPSLTDRRLERCCLRYLRVGEPGVSRARNLGMAAARFDLLVFVDDDVLPEPAWYDTLLHALVDAGPSTVVTGAVLPEPRRGRFTPSTIVDQRRAAYRGRIGRDVLYSASMAVRRSVLMDVGGFDERLGPGTPFPSAEDNDLGFRLLEAGCVILYEPQAVLYHRAWRRRRDFLPMRWRYGVGRGAFYAKHLTLRDGHMARRLLQDVGDHGTRSVRSLRADPLSAIGNLVLVVGILTGTVRWSLTHPKKH